LGKKEAFGGKVRAVRAVIGEGDATADKKAEPLERSVDGTPHGTTELGGGVKAERPSFTTDLSFRGRESRRVWVNNSGTHRGPRSPGSLPNGVSHGPP